MSARFNLREAARVLAPFCPAVPRFEEADYTLSCDPQEGENRWIVGVSTTRKGWGRVSGKARRSETLVASDDSPFARTFVVRGTRSYVVLCCFSGLRLGILQRNIVSMLWTRIYV